MQKNVVEKKIKTKIGVSEYIMYEIAVAAKQIQTAVIIHVHKNVHLYFYRTVRCLIYT